jgi:hypothetical protein
MTEPTYEFIKGKGWVPTNRWCIIFKSQNATKWKNAAFTGSFYTEYDKAVMQLNHFNNSSIFVGWEFKLIPYTEGCDRFDDEQNP